MNLWGGSDFHHFSTNFAHGRLIDGKQLPDEQSIKYEWTEYLMVFATLSEVKALLVRNQPMPGDLDDAFNYGEYREVLEALKRNPDPECIHLFLSSLHDSCNESICQGFSEVLRAQEISVTIDQLISVLSSERGEPKGWAAEYAIDFPDVRLIQPLAKLLRNPQVSSDAILFAVAALEKIAETTGSQLAREIIKADYESDPQWAQIRNQEKASEGAFARMKMEHAIAESETAFQAKDYNKVVLLLSPFGEALPLLSQKRLAVARKHI